MGWPSALRAGRALNGVAEPQHRTHLPPNLSLREGSSRTERGTPPPPAVANLTSGRSGGKVPSVQIGASGTPTESRGGVLMSLAKNVLLALATAVGACALATGASAGPFTVAPLTTASGPSPFAGCTVGAAPGSVLYPNAE